MRILSFIFLVSMTTVITSISLYLTPTDSHSLPTPNRPQVLATSTSTISAIIGGGKFTLFGFTSPKAAVTVEGLGILEETSADETGFFAFYNRFSPLLAREACVSARDQSGRVSLPICLSAFETGTNMIVGPVILPPTISINGGNYYVGDEVMLSGQTIPSSDVKLSFFTDDNRSIWRFFLQRFSLVKTVQAYSIPEIQTQSDSQGFFTIAIPTSQPDQLRTFANVFFDKNVRPLANIIIPSGESGKSTTINFKILPANHFIELIILLQILLAIPLLIMQLYPHSFTHPLAKREITPLVLKTDDSLILKRSLEDKLDLRR